MRIGIISDTHGNLAAVRMALDVLRDIDLLVHVGDVLYHPPRLGFTEGYDIPGTAELLNSLKTPTVIAQGNCDAQVYEELLNVPVMSPYAYAQVNSFGVLASHGHLMSKSRLLELAERFGAKIAVSGHTHIPVLKEDKGIIYMNPGSPALSKYENEGIPVHTVGLVTGKSASIINIQSGDVIMHLDI